MSAKKASKSAFVEHAWKVVLQQFDRGRQRSGKTLAKQSDVDFIQIDRGQIGARISSKGFDGGTYIVEIPCVDNWQTSVDKLAAWFARRLDWFAACLSGEWNDDFLDLVNTEGLHLFPDHSYANRLQWEAKCTCNSTEPICKHVIAVIYKMIWEMEFKPIRAIEFVCVNPKVLSDKIHVLSAKRVAENEDMNGKKDVHQTEHLSFSITHMTNSEQITFAKMETLRENIRPMQIIPTIHPNELKDKREIYMMW